MRNFSQSFFLAPQDRGYFVLNDIFRYIENGDQQDGKLSSANEVVAPGILEQSNVTNSLILDLSFILSASED